MYTGRIFPCGFWLSYRRSRRGGAQGVTRSRGDTQFCRASVAPEERVEALLFARAAAERGIQLTLVCAPSPPSTRKYVIRPKSWSNKSLSLAGPLQVNQVSPISERSGRVGGVRAAGGGKFKRKKVLFFRPPVVADWNA